MSIEEKAKAYDEAKARMSKAWNDNRCSLYFMNEIFPEFNESEDERIWKTLIEYFNAYPKDYYGELKKSEILSFLKKRKPINYTDDVRLTIIQFLEYASSYGCPDILSKEKAEIWIAWLEKQGEKACNLLARMIWEITYEDLKGDSTEHYDKIEFIEDFKNYLKGE